MLSFVLAGWLRVRGTLLRGVCGDDSAGRIGLHLCLCDAGRDLAWIIGWDLTLEYAMGASTVSFGLVEPFHRVSEHFSHRVSAVAGLRPLDRACRQADRTSLRGRWRTRAISIAGARNAGIHASVAAMRASRGVRACGASARSGACAAPSLGWSSASTCRRSDCAGDYRRCW